MNPIPNPFLEGSSNQHNTLPVRSTPPQHPGFLLMTRPPNAGINNTNASFNASTSNGNTQTNNNFIPWSSPNSFKNRMPSPKNLSRGGRHNHNTSREYSAHDNNPRFNIRQSPNHSPDFRGSNSPHFQQNSPMGNYRGRGRGQNWKNYSPNRTSFQHSNMQRTPLKEIPIDKFISIRVKQNPWIELEEQMDNSLIATAPIVSNHPCSDAINTDCESSTHEKPSKSNFDTGTDDIFKPTVNSTHKDIPEEFYQIDT